MAAKRTQPADRGLQEIAEWGQWFLNAHLTNLCEQGLDERTFAMERARIEALTTAITTRMREDFLTRRAPR